MEGTGGWAHEHVFDAGNAAGERGTRAVAWLTAAMMVVEIVAWVGIGAFAGMLALAITSFALIGKLFSEAIENIDPGPIEAVNSTGANRLQMIAFAILGSGDCIEDQQKSFS